MKQIFTIIWIEDKPRSMKSQVEDIGEYLIKENFEPNIIQCETGEELEAALKTGEVVDIIVTDKNLPGRVDGIGILKLLKKKHILTDVLFYSARRFHPDDARKEHYGFVEIVECKQITEQLKKLIDKNLKRCEDIVFLRGMVISAIIDLELKMNEFFANYFEISKGIKSHFHNLLLENKYNSLAGKKTTLSGILKAKGIDKSKELKGLSGQIVKLAEERNLLAHCKIDPTKKGILISMGIPERFDKNRVNGIMTKVNRVSEQLNILIEKFKPKS